MSKTTHTPGPWMHDGRNVFRKDMAVDGNAGRCRTVETRVCKVDAYHTGGGTQVANINLIASAPDLLAACKAALAALSQPMTYPADIAAAKKWLTDAAAKAECRA